MSTSPIPHRSGGKNNDYSSSRIVKSNSRHEPTHRLIVRQFERRIEEPRLKVSRQYRITEECKTSSFNEK